MTNILKFTRTSRWFENLTPEEQTVRTILSKNATIAELAVGYDKSEQTIRNVKGLKTHRARMVHTLMVDHGETAFLIGPRRRFTDEEVEHIRTSPKKSNWLAEEYGCSPSTIRMLRTGKTYASRGKR